MNDESKNTLGSGKVIKHNSLRTVERLKENAREVSIFKSQIQSVDD